MDDYTWVHNVAAVDLEELSRLYRIAPLGDKPPEALATVFGNGMFTCFVYASGVLAGAGRVLADGLDCAYLADVAVHPDHQRHGLGTAIIRQLLTFPRDTRRSSFTPTRALNRSTPGSASCA